MNPIIEDNGDKLVEFIRNSAPAELDALLQESGFYDIQNSAPVDPRPMRICVGSMPHYVRLNGTMNAMPVTHQHLLPRDITAVAVSAGNYEQMPMAA